MSGIMQRYIRAIDAINYRLGRIVMYGIFLLMGILLWSSVSKTFFLPSLWTLEMAQFVLHCCLQWHGASAHTVKRCGA